MSERRIRIVVLPGSVRPGNYTSRALRVVVDEARTSEHVTVDLVDVAAIELRLPGLGETDAVKQLQATIREATGVILATPEYHGSMSSVMKLLIDNLGFPSVLAGKPVALLGVAAGQIGAIKALEHLRSVCSHVGAIVLPGAVSVAGVQRLFDDAGVCLDKGVEERIRGVATTLLDYIHGHICPKLALEEMVRSGNTDWMQRVGGRP